MTIYHLLLWGCLLSLHPSLSGNYQMWRSNWDFVNVWKHININNKYCPKGPFCKERKASLSLQDSIHWLGPSSCLSSVVKRNAYYCCCCWNNFRYSFEGLYSFGPSPMSFSCFQSTGTIQNDYKLNCITDLLWHWTRTKLGCRMLAISRDLRLYANAR